MRRRASAVALDPSVACCAAPLARVARRASLISAVLTAALAAIACEGAAPGDADAARGDADAARGDADTGTRPVDGGATDAGRRQDGGAPSDAGPRPHVPATPEEQARLFGDDRVADALRGRLDATFDGPAAIARAVGADPACARPNVHVAVERQTRVDLHSYASDTSLPRVIVTGCEGDAHAIFVVHTSPAAPTDLADPLRESPTTELMALDRTTRRYNFYALTRDEGDRVTLKRWVRAEDGEVRILEKPPDAAMTERTDFDSGCFYCHTSDSPILLETDPFGPAWPDPGAFPAGYEGWTAAFVAEADAVGALAVVVDAGIRANIEEGWAPARRDAGALPRLVDHVFCPSERQLVSPEAGRVASSLLLDPTVAGEPAALLEGPADLPALLRVPVRSRADATIEAWLVTTGLLSEEVVVAGRLIGEGDLSRTRCAAYRAMSASIADTPDALEGSLRVALTAWWTDAPVTEERTLALRLLDPDDDASDALAAYRAAHIAERDAVARTIPEAELRAIARDRAAWMFERFGNLFAPNLLVYEDWGID